VTAPAPSRFDGAALLSAMEGLDLVHGRFDIFHRMHPLGRPVFSIANLLEPGTFDPATMRSGAYPGVAIFAVLPGPVPGHHALDDLMATARSLADRLGGNLLDDRGAMLSVQRMAQMREEVTVFERQLTGARAG
jgi:cell division protein ZipA